MTTTAPTLQGLSRDVTLAVLSRLYTEELVLELSRRNINMGGHSINKGLLVSVLRDVMTKEYDVESEKHTPDDDTVDMSLECFDDVELAEQEQFQTQALQTYSGTSSRICPSRHEDKSSSDDDNKDSTTSKESDNSDAFTDTGSSITANSLTATSTAQRVNDTANESTSKYTTVAPANFPSVSKVDTAQRIKQEVEEDVTIIGSFSIPSKQETSALDVTPMPGTSNSCQDELNIDTTTFRTHVLGIDGLMSNSCHEKPSGGGNTCEETSSTCPPTPDQGDVHRWECRLSDNDGVGQVYQQSSPERTESYTEDGDVLFIKSGDDRSNINRTSSRNNAQSDRPRNMQTAENTASPIPDRSLQNICKPYTCNICGLQSAYTLTNHMRRHKGDKPFMCGECGYRAYNKHRLVDHMRKHTGEKPFKCDQCDFKAAYKRQLSEHLKKQHFSCEFCDYKTYLKSKLKKHMEQHAGVKPTNVRTYVRTNMKTYVQV